MKTPDEKKEPKRGRGQRGLVEGKKGRGLKPTEIEYLGGREPSKKKVNLFLKPSDGKAGGKRSEKRKKKDPGTGKVA